MVSEIKKNMPNFITSEYQDSAVLFYLCYNSLFFFLVNDIYWSSFVVCLDMLVVLPLVCFVNACQSLLFYMVIFVFYFTKNTVLISVYNFTYETVFNLSLFAKKVSALLSKENLKRAANHVRLISMIHVSRIFMIGALQ